MIEFNIEKLKKNCPVAKAIFNLKKPMEEFYKEDTITASVVKPLLDESNMSLENFVSNFSCFNKENVTNFEEIKKILSEISPWSCRSCANKHKDKYGDTGRNCVFYMAGMDFTQLAYKEVMPSLEESNKYPIDKFPRLLSDYIQQLSEAMVAPPQFIGTELLAVLSTLCSRFACVQATPTWQVELLGYYLIVGDVSTKKSPTMNKVLSLLEPHITADERIIANDSTIEALELLLHKNKAILLQADEAGIMSTLGGYTKMSNTSTSKLLSLYTGKPSYIDRKGQESVLVERPRLSILAGVQPKVLETSKELTRTGMLQRFMVAYAQRSHEYRGFSDKDVDEQIKKGIKELVRTLFVDYAIDDEPEVIKLSKPALRDLEILQDVIDTDIENTNSDALKDYYGKYMEHVIKIAGIFHIIKVITGEEKNRHEISRETFGMAQSVSFYYSGVSKIIFDNIEYEPLFDIERGYKQLLENCKDGYFNPTFLNNGRIGGCDARKPEITRKFIERLIEQNRCIEIEHTGKGKKYLLIKE